MKHRHYYILIDDEAVPCEDVATWARWFETAERHVATDRVGGVQVSTVFLGLDHDWGLGPLPVLWETMIFGGPHDEYQERYTSRTAALAGHQRALALVQSRA